jgi:hypothetical protein
LRYFGGGSSRFDQPFGVSDLTHGSVTANPTGEWVARQITEAFPWDEAPRYLIRDRDWIYGSVVTRRLSSPLFGTRRRQSS